MGRSATAPTSRGARGPRDRRRSGFAPDYSWLKVDALDENGRPAHRRGVATEPGVYFVGLPWLSRRGSSFIWGVWHDAKHIAGHITTQRSYLAYDRT